MLIILLMAGEAIHGCTFKLLVEMARYTGYFAMLAFLFERSKIVIEFCRSQALSSVTLTETKPKAALTGFVMVCVWMVYWVSETLTQAALPSGLGAHAGLGLFGLLLAVVSWAWGLASGLAIVREAKERVSPAGR